jgi:cytochrome c oxidase cbb3-type subunit III
MTGPAMTRRRWVVFAWLLPLTAGLPLGCDAPGKPNPAERPLTPDQVLTFTALFRTNCSGCHGADGRLGPAPPLNDPLFRGIVSEQDLEHVIASGRPGTPMPAFARENGGALTALQVQILVKEIKGVSYKIVSSGAAGKPKVVVASTAGTLPTWGTPPVASAVPPYALPEAGGDREQGARVFAQACAGCHGEHGKGVANDERPLRINDPAFLALISDQALRRIVITGRPDLGMPDYAGKSMRPDQVHPLTSDQITHVVALLAYWREGGTANGR